MGLNGAPLAALVEENPAIDLGLKECPVFGVWSSEVGLGSPFAMLVEDTAVDLDLKECLVFGLRSA